jgi:hypothetical protein
VRSDTAKILADAQRSRDFLARAANVWRAEDVIA